MQVTHLIPWTRRNPYARREPSFPSVLGEVDRLFGDLWQGVEHAPTRRAFAFAPRLDVRETNEAITVKVDLPGVDQKDVEIVAHEGVLTIRGERQQEESSEEKGHTWSERAYGRFERTLTVPETADLTTANATYANGVLTITIPKTPESIDKPHTIPVQSA